jgi:ribosomal-protein-alanine N-acetyltransferase
MERLHKFPHLETERLFLREITLDDLEFYFRHFNNQQIIEGCCHPGPDTIDVAKNELELYCISPFKEGRGIRWGIVLKNNNEMIGTLGFYDWNKTVRKVEIGYDLNPKYWGLGIMTEALLAVLHFCFNTLKLNRVQAIIDSKNDRSINLIRKLDFKLEGVLRQNSSFNGKFRDDFCFSLLKKEWVEKYSYKNT